MSSPMQYFGGKHYLAKTIVDFMPEHKQYCEVFGGAGHVLFRKEPVYHETFNDRDDLIVNLFQVIRDEKERLLEKIQYYPYSRSLFLKMKRDGPPQDPFERAVWYFYVNRTSFNGGGDSFSCGRMKSVASAYRYTCNLLEEFSRRLSRVVIECLDFEECIEKYDHSEMLFYLDPPYVGNETFYKVAIEKSDHVRLYRLLRNLKGKAILSYVKCDLIDRMYHDWNSFEVRKANHSSIVKKGGKKSFRSELILTNF